MLKRTISLLLLTTATAGLGAATADARAPSFGSKFLVYVKGSQHTTAKDNVTYSYENACNKWTGTSSGDETISFHSTRPQRVRMLTSPFPVMMYGNDPTIQGLPLVAKINRRVRGVKTTIQKGCGEPARTEIYTGTDCGSRVPSWDGRFEGGFTKVKLAVTESILAPITKQGYDGCELGAPLGERGMTPQVGEITDISARIPAKRFKRLKKGQKLVINASQSFSKSADPRVTKTQTVTWQIRLLRLK